jgi:outer membrane receptor protein involved in Fe transport
MNKHLLRIVPSLLAASVLLALAGTASAQSAAGADQSPPAAQAQSDGATRPLPAPAQSSAGPASSGKVETLQSVEVTGSRVISSSFLSTNPMITIGKPEIDAISPNNISDLVITIPSVVTSYSSTVGKNDISNGLNGLNTANLRDLGSDRTLIMLNGHRVVGSTTSGLVDLNTMPQGLINGIDVVTGGASAVYGSDAVAGVINFKLDTTYTGVKGFVQGGQSKYGDDTQAKYGLTLGLPFAGDRGHFVFDAGYARNGGIGSMRDRPWYRSWGDLQNPAWTPTNGEPKLITVPWLNRTEENPGGIITGPDALKFTAFNPDGSPRAYQHGLLGRTGSEQSGGEMDGHYAVMALKTRNARRYAYGRLSFDLSDSVNVYGAYTHSETESSTVASYTYYDGSFQIQSDNAFLDPGLRSFMNANDIDEFTYGLIVGKATEDFDIKYDRAILGLDAQLSDFWSLHAFYESGRSRVRTELNDVTNDSRMELALDAVVDPATNRIVCRSTLTDPGNGCVPLNSFGVGNMSAAALDYVTGQAWYDRTFKQQVGSVNVTGQPWMLWAGPLNVAFGADFRKQSIGNATSDAESQLSNWRFGNFLPTTGSDKVTELFGEFSLPLMEEDKLNLNAAVRSADYHYSGRQLAWKVGLTWSPVQSIMVRAMQSRDIRAPNLAELFQSGLTHRVEITDHFNGDKLRNTEETIRGNKALNPEIGHTTTLGLVYMPTWASGLQAAVDFYRIRIDDAITSIDDQETVDRCFAGDQQICRNVVFFPDGTIDRLINAPVNIAEQYVKGMDFNVAYHRPLPSLGSDAALTIRALATNQTQNRTTTPFSTSNIAGRVTGNGARWKGRLTTTFSKGPFKIGAVGRFIGHGKLRNYWVEGVDIDDNTVPSVWYFELFGSYSFMHDRLEAYFHVSNLFDRDPVVIATDSGGFNPQLYDVVGRYTTVGLRFNF